MSENEWGFTDEADLDMAVPLRREDRFIYDFERREVVEVVGLGDEGNIVLSSGDRVRPAEAASLKFSASLLDALYRARDDFLQSEYQRMMDLTPCSGGGVDSAEVLN